MQDLLRAGDQNHVRTIVNVGSLEKVPESRRDLAAEASGIIAIM
jgi:hypothetical protein